MDIIYRRATSEDAAALLVYQHIVGGETDFLSFDADAFNISIEKESKFIDRFSKSKRDIMLVALDGDIIVGNAIIETERAKRYAHRATLSITVLREYWGRGIGSRLMEMLLSIAPRNEVSVVSLEVRSDNSRAISLYRKFGFERIGTYKRYFKIDGKYYDADLMQLLL